MGWLYDTIAPSVPDGESKIFPSTSKRSTLRVVEATIGAFFAFALGFVLLLISCIAANGIWNEDNRWLLLPLVIVACLELRFLYVLKVNLEEGHYPFAPYFAMQYQSWPLVLRPVAALWWLGHFAAGIAAILFADNLLVMNMTDWNTRVLRSLLFIVVSFTIAYSANLFLLLTVTALGGGQHAISRIWGYRVLMDLAIAVVAAFFPVFQRLDLDRNEKPMIPSHARPQYSRPMPSATTESAK